MPQSEQYKPFGSFGAYFLFSTFNYHHLAIFPMPHTRNGVLYAGVNDEAVEHERRLRYIRTLSRVDQIMVHRLYNAYKERPGFIYCNIRLSPQTGRVLVKAGRTNNIERRMKEYSKCGPGQILWVCYFATGIAKATDNPKVFHILPSRIPAVVAR
ncbi:hypothetical protein B0H12DRAFT_1069872 [Mycena haematopus]|nr:hypothetical protein B0H12DRAFT_1069872 [Mycena haematopus]